MVENGRQLPWISRKLEPGSAIVRGKFQTIFGLGEEILGKKLPSEVLIIAVEAADVTSFSEECTPHVKDAIDKVARLVKSKLTA